MRDLTACTIVSKNYLPFARVLARSFLEHHPRSRVFVCLVDQIDGCFDPADEPFEVITADRLGIERFEDFSFKYTILELNTAVKPAFLRHLFAHHGAEKLIYFDPDIQVMDRLVELSAVLDEHTVALTPHLDTPIDDEYLPGETHILQAGAYNLGFIALSGAAAAKPLLDWWHRRVYDRCVVDIPKGLFVDQKWIDLVPSLFSGVHLLKDPGYNVAYWNLHGRTVTLEDAPGAEGRARVNGRPLRFFHFSGFDPHDVERVSKHQNRFRLGDIGQAKELYLAYRERLLAAGWRETRGWAYAYDRFADGTRVPDIARSFYRSQGPSRLRFGDPFATGEGSFFEWMREGAKGRGEGGLSRLLHHLYRSRDDLIEGYPDPFGRDRLRLGEWLLEAGPAEYRLDDLFLEPFAMLRDGEAGGSAGASATSPRGPRMSLAAKARRVAGRLYRGSLAKKVKYHLKRSLGEERAKALKRRLRPGRPVVEGPGRGLIASDVSRLAITRHGVNICGYISAESGMGEGVRGLIRSLKLAGIPYSLCNLELGVASRTGDRSFQDFSDNYDYDINLFFVNADQVPHIFEQLSHEKFRRKYNVGYWMWELEQFPRRWDSSFPYFHEIWTASSFCADAIGAASPVPVRKVGLPVGFEAPEEAVCQALERRLGLPSEPFTFLFIFDFLSYPERKNPLGLVRAFQRAFKTDEPVQLVLKTINSQFAQDAVDELKAAIGDYSVILVDEYLSKDEVHALASLADCYVSLHRAEGFGLTLAEAMVLGKPVIATAYSGNTDFMNVNNSYPVRYRLVEIEEDLGPYPAGATWAEPDEDHAARCMRLAFERPAEVAALAERARADIASHHGVEAVAAILVQRFQRIYERVNGSSGEQFGLAGGPGSETKPREGEQ